MIIAWVMFILFLLFVMICIFTAIMSYIHEDIETFVESLIFGTIAVLFASFPAQYIWGG